MLFPIAIHKDDGSVYGVTVPDVPGCFSAGDTLDDAIASAKEAIFFHLETLVEDGEEINITPSTVEDLKQEEVFSNATWALVDVDLTDLDKTPERVNISLPRFVLRKIDKRTKERHETRSGFLARAALEALAH